MSGMRRVGGWLAAALLASAALFASNMGLRVTRTLKGPLESASGTSWLALPYKPKPGLTSAATLWADLGGASNVVSISRYDAPSGTLQTYTGNAQDDFALAPGEGLRVQVAATVDYRILGAHDPGVVITLLGPESSPTGTNQFSPPFNAKAGSAAALRDEIGRNIVTGVSRWITATDTLETYAGASNDIDFALVPGESYLVGVNRTVQYLPVTR